MRKCVLLLLTVAMTGCSWFSWLPWVDKDEESKKLKPAELVKFDAEVRIDRSWRASVGERLRRVRRRVR